MIRLVYVSQLHPTVDEQGLAAIVERAAERNAAIGITGVLAFDGARICQILEGEESTLLPLFAKIVEDGRHEGVVEIDRREISWRQFAEWSMVRRPMVDMVVAVLAD